MGFYGAPGRLYGADGMEGAESRTEARKTFLGKVLAFETGRLERNGPRPCAFWNETDQRLIRGRRAGRIGPG